VEGGIKTGDHYLREGSEEKGPWFPLGKFDKEEIEEWERKGLIKWAYI